MRHFLWVGWLLAIAGGAGALRGADLLVVAATDEELQPIVERMSAATEEKRAGWIFWRGKFGTKELVLACGEGDPLNAVAATTLAIRRDAPKLILVFGAARRHDPSLQPGDVVVSERFAAFDGLFSHPKKVGEGSNSLEWETLPHLLMTAGERETPMLAFPADPAGLAALRKLTPPPGGRLVVGTLGSANQFNAEPDRIAWIREHWQTSCEDEESAHIAGCATLFKVPVVGLAVIARWETPPGAPAPGGQRGRRDSAAEQTASRLALEFLEAWK